MRETTFADVKAAIEAGNQHFSDFIERQTAINAVLIELQAESNRRKFHDSGGPAATPRDFAGSHDFLFGSKVRATALEGKALSSEIDLVRRLFADERAGSALRAAACRAIRGHGVRDRLHPDGFRGDQIACRANRSSRGTGPVRATRSPNRRRHGRLAP